MYMLIFQNCARIVHLHVLEILFNIAPAGGLAFHLGIDNKGVIIPRLRNCSVRILECILSMLTLSYRLDNNF